jgi:hypothetical protein
MAGVRRYLVAERKKKAKTGKKRCFQKTSFFIPYMYMHVLRDDLGVEMM